MKSVVVQGIYSHVVKKVHMLSTMCFLVDQANFFYSFYNSPNCVIDLFSFVSREKLVFGWLGGGEALCVINYIYSDITIFKTDDGTRVSIYYRETR